MTKKLQFEQLAKFTQRGFEHQSWDVFSDSPNAFRRDRRESRPWWGPNYYSKLSCQSLRAGLKDTRFHVILLPCQTFFKYTQPTVDPQ